MQSSPVQEHCLKFQSCCSADLLFLFEVFSYLHLITLVRCVSMNGIYGSAQSRSHAHYPSPLAVSHQPSTAMASLSTSLHTHRHWPLLRVTFNVSLHSSSAHVCAKSEWGWVCVCVCERERERQRERQGERECTCMLFCVRALESGSINLMLKINQSSKAIYTLWWYIQLELLDMDFINLFTFVSYQSFKAIMHYLSPNVPLNYLQWVLIFSFSTLSVVLQLWWQTL